MLHGHGKRTGRPSITPLIIEIPVRGRLVTALIDTSSTIDIVSRTVATVLGLSPDSNTRISIHYANGTAYTDGRLSIPLQLNFITHIINPQVLPHPPYHIILGIETCRLFGLVIDLVRNEVRQLGFETPLNSPHTHSGPNGQSPLSTHTHRQSGPNGQTNPHTHSGPNGQSPQIAHSTSAPNGLTVVTTSTHPSITHRQSGSNDQTHPHTSSIAHRQSGPSGQTHSLTPTLTSAPTGLTNIATLAHLAPRLMARPLQHDSPTMVLSPPNGQTPQLASLTRPNRTPRQSEPNGQTTRLAITRASDPTRLTATNLAHSAPHLMARTKQHDSPTVVLSQPNGQTPHIASLSRLNLPSDSLSASRASLSFDDHALCIADAGLWPSRQLDPAPLKKTEPPDRETTRLASNRSSAHHTHTQVRLVSFALQATRH